MGSDMTVADWSLKFKELSEEEKQAVRAWIFSDLKGLSKDDLVEDLLEHWVDKEWDDALQRYLKEK